MENLFSPHFSQSMADFGILLQDLPYDQENPSGDPPRKQSKQQINSADQVGQNGTPDHDDEVVPPAMMMSRSESERFLQELCANSSTPQSLGTESSISSEQDAVLAVVDKRQLPAPPPQTVDFSVLKAKLDMACAAAATIFGGNSSPQPEDSRGNQFSSLSKLKAHVPGIGDNHSMELSESNDVQGRCEMKDSSEEDLEINDVADARREKRKGPNRDSAKFCPRKREHDNINTVEAKVYELMDANASLVSQIADMKKKHDEAVADNVTFKSEIMTLKATVTVVERIVKQLVRMNPDVLLMLNSPNEGHGQQFGQGRGLIAPSASANVGVPIQANYIVGIPCGTANVPVNHGVGVGVGVDGPFPSASTVPINHRVRVRVGDGVGVGVGVGVNGPFPSASTVPVNHGVGVGVGVGVGANGPFPSVSTVLFNHGVRVGVGVGVGFGVNGPFPSASTAATYAFRDQTLAGMPFIQPGNNLFGSGHTFLA